MPRCILWRKLDRAARQSDGFIEVTHLCQGVAQPRQCLGVVGLQIQGTALRLYGLLPAICQREQTAKMTKRRSVVGPVDFQDAALS